jgi:uncharacterized membrane protein YoaK (UPF0700 family)
MGWLQILKRRLCGDRESSVWKPANADETLPFALLGMTAVTGLLDAVSFLSLGHIFTANMTGNVVILAFAVAHAPGVSLTRSLTALVAFFVGAAVGGRILIRARTDDLLRSALLIFALEIAFLATAMLAALGHSSVLQDSSATLYTIIVCTALAMGMRNAAVRKLGVADLTTTVLTLTITGLAADSSLAGGSNSHWQRRLAAVLAMFAGAAIGALLIKRSVFAALALAVAITSVSSALLLAADQWGLQNRGANVGNG